MPHSFTGGVKPMTIQTRLTDERERLMGMTDAERAWRKQWLKDQELSPNEPRYVPEYWKARTNPIRRFYRWPLDTIFKPLAPILGAERAAYMRYFTGKFFLIALGVYGTCYYFKYNKNDWTRKGGWRMYHNKPYILPGHPEYPKVSEKSKPSDYYDRGFKNSPI